MSKTQTISILAAVGILAAAGITSWGQTPEPELRFGWRPPTYGTPVVEYEGQIIIWETELGEAAAETLYFATPDTLYDFPYPFGCSTKARVRGKDAQDRVGPYSLFSETWVDNRPGPPVDIGFWLVVQ